MANFLENAIDLRLKRELLKVKDKDKNIKSFKSFKQSFPWLAAGFDLEIDNFYETKIEQKIITSKLSVDIQREIYLFYWIRENGLEILLDNYEKIYTNLEKVSSPFLIRMSYYRLLLKSEKSDFHLIFQNFINEWQNILIKRVVDNKLALINDLRKEYLRVIYDQIAIIKKFRQLSGFIWNFFGRFWDGDVKEIEKLNLKQIYQLAKFLQDDPTIMTIARLLGRLKGQSDRLEAITTESVTIEYEIRPAGKWPEEVVGITESDNLEHLLAIELVNLNIKKLQPIFLKKFVEKKLSTFEFISKDLVAVETIEKTIENKPIPEDEGPFILCIDTSASMSGQPEYIAKALCLAIVRIALKQKRDCYMINFSDKLEVFDLTKVSSSLKILVKFLSHSFHASTNVTPALLQTIKVMDYKKYLNGDLLIISDFLTIDLDSNVINTIKFLKEERANRFHAITIGCNGNEKITKHFDNNWIYDPKNPFTQNDIIAKMEEKLKYSNIKKKYKI